MVIEIMKVSTKKDLKKFVRFYTYLYKDCRFAPTPLHFDEILTLSKNQNPAFTHCKSQYWIAYSNGSVVGRIAAIINKNETESKGESIGRFGWFDFIDNTNVSEALMHEAIRWFKSENIKKIHGPLGITDLDRQGMLIKGFEKMGTFATIYNYAYYSKHMQLLGFNKSTDWIEYEIEESRKMGKTIVGILP
jgi:hypothetical protein